MVYPDELLTWTAQVSRHMPQLTRSQAQMLAWYSFAASIVQSCGISSVTYFLAHVLKRSETSLRQRLRETLYDASDKRGSQRRESDVVACFGPLLKWISSLGRSPDGQLWLALDATTLRQTFTVLSISVLVGRCAIPVAWAILPANQPGSWKPHWQRLLAALPAAAPADCQVLVLADRGLYAQWLFNAIVANRWHPLLRINAQGSVCLRDTGQRLALAQLRRQCRGHLWHGRVLCFTGRQQLACTLLVQWDDRQQDAWLLLTDLPPTQVSPAWYALRMHIEFGFRSLKSAGFHWERTRMRDPARAERLWLVLALASLRLAMLAPTYEFDHSTASAYPALSLFKRGILRQLAALIRHAQPQTFPLHFPAMPPPPWLCFLSQLNTYP